MKSNIEAWQMGEQDGWNDGYYDKLPKTETDFTFPSNWTQGEKQSYIQGYHDGYTQGSQDS